MQLLNPVKNEAVLSNVGQIGEFRIRNSAKAFNILSSGLYANKIRAIVRELSCNAVDSHTAAGKADTPFDVHLPSAIEPWFSIRDYGTGLNHEQVTNIYTTYFESTKTNSNDFIGALGLGSKSPFSYTDNFTVTAIRDGRKGIYTAFINEAGVPSIALMMEEATDEAAGVEVKFAVEDRYDFGKFVDEARTVYTYFKLRPVVTGVSGFKFREVEYETKDIVPGVHNYSERHSSRSVAVMGNIAYPIEVPSADKVLGGLHRLLNCGLEIHFNIGELDFQASREGLSYIPQTVESIRRKLTELNSALTVVLGKEADAIPNLWDRAVFLTKKASTGLWTSAVEKYVADTSLPTYDPKRYQGTKTFRMYVDEVAKKYNIALAGFNVQPHSKSYPNMKHESEWGDQDPITKKYHTRYYWGITVSDNVDFIINDTKIGAAERGKYHYRQSNPQRHTRVYVLNQVNKNKEMDTKGFFAEIYNPPEGRIAKASSLLKKERDSGSVGKNVTILKMEERGYGGYYRQREMIWRDAGKADTFDNTKTYYYLPLKGFEVLSKDPGFALSTFIKDLKDCGLANIRKDVYGVRKTDIEYIKTQKNWVNIEDFLAVELAKPVDQKFIASLALQNLDGAYNLSYNYNIVALVDDQSPYKAFVSKFKGVEKAQYSEQSLRRLSNAYAKDIVGSAGAQVRALVDEGEAVKKRYPMLDYVSRTPNEVLADYINMVDKLKGI